MGAGVEAEWCWSRGYFMAPELDFAWGIGGADQRPCEFGKIDRLVVVGEIWRPTLYSPPATKCLSFAEENMSSGRLFLALLL